MAEPELVNDPKEPEVVYQYEPEPQYQLVIHEVVKDVINEVI